jgi:hypothetical protein
MGAHQRSDFTSDDSIGQETNFQLRLARIYTDIVMVSCPNARFASGIQIDCLQIMLIGILDSHLKRAGMTRNLLYRLSF